MSVEIPSHAPAYTLRISRQTIVKFGVKLYDPVRAVVEEVVPKFLAAGARAHEEILEIHVLAHPDDEESS